MKNRNSKHGIGGKVATTSKTAKRAMKIEARKATAETRAQKAAENAGCGVELSVIFSPESLMRAKMPKGMSKKEVDKVLEDYKIRLRGGTASLEPAKEEPAAAEGVEEANTVGAD